MSRAESFFSLINFNVKFFIKLWRPRHIIAISEEPKKSRSQSLKCPRKNVLCVEEIMEIIEEAGSELHHRAASVSISNTSRRRWVQTRLRHGSYAWKLTELFQTRKGEKEPSDSLHHKWSNDLHCLGGHSRHRNFSLLSHNWGDFWWEMSSLKL